MGHKSKDPDDPKIKAGYLPGLPVTRPRVTRVSPFPPPLRIWTDRHHGQVTFAVGSGMVQPHSVGCGGGGSLLAAATTLPVPELACVLAFWTASSRSQGLVWSTAAPLVLGAPPGSVNVLNEQNQKLDWSNLLC